MLRDHESDGPVASPLHTPQENLDGQDSGGLEVEWTRGHRSEAGPLSSQLGTGPKRGVMNTVSNSHKKKQLK